MNPGFTTLVANLGMSLQNIIILVVMLGGLVFYAKDFKLGVLLHFFMSASLFVAYYVGGWDTSIILTIMLIFLVILALTLYSVSKTTKQPGGAFI